jgi:hypothetical protein
MTFDYADPFLTYIPLDASPDQVQRLLQRQELIETSLEGREAASTVLDCLAEQGLDPIAYIDAVESGVDQAINSGILPDHSDLLLILRE